MRVERKTTIGQFTLVELLVVIAIIAILASLLLPALKNSLSIAKQTKCKSNLKQRGQCAYMYLDDFMGYFPSGDPTNNVNDGGGVQETMACSIPGAVRATGKSSLTKTGMPPYDATTELLLCPSAASSCPFYSYAWNSYLASPPHSNTYGLYANIRQITRPSGIMFMADSTWHSAQYWDYTDSGSGLPAKIALRHFLRTNVLYADAHVEAYGNTIGHPELFR